MAVDRLVAAELADPLGGRAQLAGEVALDRRLQRAEPVEAELGGQPHDGGRAGAGRLGEVGDGAEADELRALEHDLGDAPLGRRELRPGVADPLLDLHLRHRADSSGRRRRRASLARPFRDVHTGAVQLPPPPDALVRQRQRRRRPPGRARGRRPRPTTATPSPTATTAWTRASARARSASCSADVTTLLTFNGTGANVLALATLLGPAEAVVCTDGAHIAVDETGAPERILGAKLIDLPAPDGKLRPEQIDERRPT